MEVQWASKILTSNGFLIVCVCVCVCGFVYSFPGPGTATFCCGRERVERMIPPAIELLVFFFVVVIILMGVFVVGFFVCFNKCQQPLKVMATRS